MKEISVIVPVYNVEKYLRRGINSLINQSIFEKLEIIIVNDGSKDNSLNICLEYSRKHDNIIVVNQKNAGVSKARNKGLSIAKSKYICFFDPDDEIKIDMYEKLLKLIKNNQAEMAIVDFSVVFPNKKPKKKRKIIKENINGRDQIIKEFFKGGKIGNNLFDKIFLKSSLKNVRFPEERVIGEDMYFIYEYIKKINNVVIDTSYSGYLYYKNDNSAMNTKFTSKFFDPIILSELMLNDYDSNSELYQYAEAHLIHELCKVNEYMIINKADNNFKREKNALRNRIKKYKIINAKRYLTHKQFLGFLLIRYSQKIYIGCCKIMKIG